MSTRPDRFKLRGFSSILSIKSHNAMKRIRKHSPLSIVLFSISSILIALLLYSGNLLIGGGAVLFFVLGLFARKPESYEAYRDRYEQRYGMSDNEDTEDESR